MEGNQVLSGVGKGFGKGLGGGGGSGNFVRPRLERPQPLSSIGTAIGLHRRG